MIERKRRGVSVARTKTASDLRSRTSTAAAQQQQCVPLESSSVFFFSCLCCFDLLVVKHAAALLLGLSDPPFPFLPFRQTLVQLVNVGIVLCVPPTPTWVFAPHGVQ